MPKVRLWVFVVALCLTAALPAAARPRSLQQPDAACAAGAASMRYQPPQVRGGRAVWIWETAFLDELRQRREVLRFARQQNVRTLFLYATVWRLQEKPDSLRCFLAEAHRQRFTVHALQGEPNWIYPHDRAGAVKFVEALADFQRDQPRILRFDALHFDVEPQSLQEWDRDNIPRLSALYMDFLHWSRARAHAMKLPLAVDVPPWYRDHPWEDATLLDAVLELADEVALMAYLDETWRIVIDSLPAVKRAERSGKGVWIGLSADPVHLPRLPAGRSLRRELENMRGRVEKAFPRQQSFRGTAIHDYVLYQRLFCEGPACARRHPSRREPDSNAVVSG